MRVLQGIVEDVFPARYLSARCPSRREFVLLSVIPCLSNLIEEKDNDYAEPCIEVQTGDRCCRG
jgi:hypothetical protein